MFWAPIFGVLAAGGVALVALGLASLTRYRKMLSLRVTALPRLEPGNVSVKGRAVAWKPMRAAFSDKDCAYVRYEVQILERGWAARAGFFDRWKRVFRLAPNEPFYVDDGAARVLVSTKEAEMDLGESFAFDNGDKRGNVDKDKPLPLRLRMALEELHIPQEFVDESGRICPLRFVEHSIPVGARVHVLGMLSEDDVDLQRAVGKTVGASEKRVIHKGRGPRDWQYVCMAGMAAVPRRARKRTDLLLAGGAAVALLFGALAAAAIVA